MIDSGKVKEARNRFAKVIVSKLLGSLEANPIHISEIETVLVQYQEALAELEKPVQESIYGKTDSNSYYLRGLAMRVRELDEWSHHVLTVNESGDLIQQYAESYHAKKCAECKKDIDERWSFLRSVKKQATVHFPEVPRA